MPKHCEVNCCCAENEPWCIGPAKRLSCRVAACAATLLRPPASINKYASIRVFDKTGALSFDSWMNHGALLSKKSFRGVNNNDIVTAVPPEFSDYQHVGTKIYINSRYFGGIIDTIYVHR